MRFVRMVNSTTGPRDTMYAFSIPMHWGVSNRPNMPIALQDFVVLVIIDFDLPARGLQMKSRVWHEILGSLVSTQFRTGACRQLVSRLLQAGAVVNSYFISCPPPDVPDPRKPRLPYSHHHRYFIDTSRYAAASMHH